MGDGRPTTPPAFDRRRPVLLTPPDPDGRRYRARNRYAATPAFRADPVGGLRPVVLLAQLRPQVRRLHDLSAEILHQGF